ncbi:hypothetical protein HW555_008545, partial [Spodoptera exigua]
QNTTKPVIQISFFEYGAHIEGEELSFAVNGFIPPFIPIFTQNVTVSELKRAEYVSPLSTVNVVFDTESLLLTFYVKFPFLNIPFGVVGYSVKPSHSRTWNTWRRGKNNIIL